MSNVIDDYSVGHTKQPGLVGQGACPECNVWRCTTCARSMVIVVLLFAFPRIVSRLHLSFFRSQCLIPKRVNS